jgi:hypothetical protein
MRNAGYTVCEKDLKTPLRFNRVSLISARTTPVTANTGAHNLIQASNKPDCVEPTAMVYMSAFHPPISPYIPPRLLPLRTGEEVLLSQWFGND